jgi:ASPIC and UnbV/FG-GAP-like repeat
VNRNFSHRSSKRRAWVRGAGAALALLLAAWAAHSAWRNEQRQDMARRLAKVVAAQGAWDNPWDLQERKIASLQQDLARERDPLQRLLLKREIAQQYVNGGSPEPAIALLESVLAEYQGKLGAQDLATLNGDLAFAFFRIGEQQNCAANPSADVCLLPLDAGAVHKQKLGASEAAKRFEALLADPALDADSALLYRWLLNIAHMQLGQYPAGVPGRWLIGPEHFKSEYDIGSFKDVAAARGIAEFGRAGGAVLEDFDNDGHLDLMLTHMGITDPMAYFRNNGDGHFTRRTEQAGLSGLLGGLNMVQADFDNDGCIDVFIARGAWFHDKGQIPSSLLRNRCDGTFEDVTARAGVLNEYPTQTAVWADFDGDGLLDLFVGNEIVRDKVQWPADAKHFRLYRNLGNGKFADVGAASGIDVGGMIKGAAADDFDNDGRIDLYVSVMGGPNRLYRNSGAAADGTPGFEDVTQRAGVAEPVMSFTTWFFDYDNDGWPDIFVSGYWASMPNIVRELIGDKANARGARPRLYRNNRDGTFTDVSRETRLDQLLLTMGANHGDLDNDGWLDFYLGTGAAPLNNVVPNQMFRNAQGRGFQNVTRSGGFGHLQKGHAVAFGDIDNNGQQDVFANIGGAMSGDKFYSVLFKNPGHPEHHWIKLELVGAKANRFGVGARLRVRVQDASGQVRDIHRTVGSGGSFGASSLRPHVGIGGSSSVTEVEVRWPGSGLVQRFAGPIVADARYRVAEGEPGLRRIEPRAPAGKR